MHHLDCLRLHTSGTPLTLHNLVARMSPSHNALTYAYDLKDSPNLYAQVINRQFADGGQFSFIVGDPHSDPGNMIELLEKTIQGAGEWGVFHLLADLPEGEPFREAFVGTGFRVWAHQRVYRFSQKDGHGDQPAGSTNFEWRTWTHADTRAMQQLYHLVVPGLFQSIEPLTRRVRLGMVAYDEKGSLLGYADLSSGPKGVWVQPVIEPSVSNPQLLRELLVKLPEVFGRPIYLAARSYQPWTQNMAEQLGSAEVSTQTLLVRYLAKPKLAYEPERDFGFESAVPNAGRSQISDTKRSD